MPLVHECNAFCRPPDHCTTIYTDGGSAGEILAQVRLEWEAAGIAARPLRVLPAPEAPPVERSGAGPLVRGAAPLTNDTSSAWLLIFRLEVRA